MPLFKNLLGVAPRLIRVGGANSSARRSRPMRMEQLEERCVLASWSSASFSLSPSSGRYDTWFEQSYVINDVQASSSFSVQFYLSGDGVLDSRDFFTGSSFANHSINNEDLNDSLSFRVNAE